MLVLTAFPRYGPGGVPPCWASYVTVIPIAPAAMFHHPGGGGGGRVPRGRVAVPSAPQPPTPQRWGGWSCFVVCFCRWFVVCCCCWFVVHCSGSELVSLGHVITVQNTQKSNRANKANLTGSLEARQTARRHLKSEQLMHKFHLH